jgi:hypothetical protein
LVHRFVRPDVVDVGAGVLLGGPDRDRLDADELADTGVGIVEITHPDGLGRTDLDTGRLETLVDAVSAEVALRRGVGVLVDVDRVVRTCLHAHLAADAAGVVEVDDPVGSDEECLGGAALDARCVGAVIAAQDRHFAGGVGEGALFDIFHPRPELAYRDVVLGLAGHRAGVAANAGPLINGESVAHAITSFECRTS